MLNNEYLSESNNFESMKDNIYIKGLEVGYKHSTVGISFNEIVSELGIKKSLSDEMFKYSFMTWFYSNFYHIKAERNLVQNPHGSFIHDGVINTLDGCKDDKSFIKGESIQKYIDYLELKEARESAQFAKKSAQEARKLSIGSVIIAVLAILIPILITEFKTESPKQVIVTENRDKVDNAVILERLTKIDSTINSTITKLSLIANKKVEAPAKEVAKTNH